MGKLRISKTQGSCWLESETTSEQYFKTRRYMYGDCATLTNDTLFFSEDKQRDTLIESGTAVRVYDVVALYTRGAIMYRCGTDTGFYAVVPDTSLMARVNL